MRLDRAAGKRQVSNRRRLCADYAETFFRTSGWWRESECQKITVSATQKISDALIVVEIPRRHTSGKRFKQDVAAFTKSLEKIRRVRAFASAAYDLCLVARGAADGYLDFSRNTKIWDVAAGELIVREAGGKISDMTLAYLKFPDISVLATNANLHAQLKAFL